LIELSYFTKICVKSYKISAKSQNALAPSTTHHFR
jgi:hypothetical protein